MDRLVNSSRDQNAIAVAAPPLGALTHSVPTVDFSPAEIVRHRLGLWRGVHVETIQLISHQRFEYTFKHKHHLLVAIEDGSRFDGELLVEGLATSTVRGCSHKLIFGRKAVFRVAISTPADAFDLPVRRSCDRRC